MVQKWQASVTSEEWESIDFLLPAVSPSWELTGNIADTVSVGMCLRSLLREIGVPSPEAYTAHSLKATLLTWARVVLLDGRDMRQQQGHHKLDMAALYARDDSRGTSFAAPGAQSPAVGLAADCLSGTGSHATSAGDCCSCAFREV